MPAQGADQQVLVQGPGQGRPQRRAPQGAKLVEAERADALDLGLDRVAIGRSQGHAGYPALRVGLLLRFGAADLSAMR